MLIERWDTADDATELHKVYAQARAVDDPAGPELSPELFRGWLACGWRGEPREVWFVPGTGWYRLVLPDRENRDRCVMDLVVSPSARRRGSGTALLEHAMRRAAAHGCSMLRGWTWGDSPGEAFAVARAGTGGPGRADGRPARRDGGPAAGGGFRAFGMGCREGA